MRRRSITALLAGLVLVTGGAAAFVYAGEPGSAHRSVSAMASTDARVEVGSGMRAGYPVGWHVVTRPLTRVVSPVQRLVVTSFALRQDRPDPGCEPVTAMRAMPASGGWLLVFEYTGPTREDLAGFPRQPARFRLDRKSYRRYECMGPSYMVRFRAAGREFQVHLYVGSRASASTRGALLAVLDSLVVRP